MKNMIIASTSTLHGQGYLEYLLSELRGLFEGIGELTFVPYARPGGIGHDAYTEVVRRALSEFPIRVAGLHEFENPRLKIARSEALFVGGGNTFVLLDRLYREDLISAIRDAVLTGTPYLGTSAGSNITGPSIKTTNDMPIVHPPSLDALGLMPFNLNPHYLDPDPDSKHQGETRETRIREFHAYNKEVVVGLREGSWITVRGDKLTLKGELSARVFKKDADPFEIPGGSELLPDGSDLRFI